MSKFTTIKAHQNLVAQIRRGIERETLRIDARGDYALDSHPRALGSTLTHPHITTDYSEALMELVTSPYADVDSLFSEGGTTALESDITGLDQFELINFMVVR